MKPITFLKLTVTAASLLTAGLAFSQRDGNIPEVIPFPMDFETPPLDGVWPRWYCRMAVRLCQVMVSTSRTKDDGGAHSHLGRRQEQSQRGNVGLFPAEDARGPVGP